MRCRKPNWPGCSQSSASIRRWGAAGSQGWKGRSMLFKPDVKDDAKTVRKRVARGIGRRMVSLTVTLLILGGLGYLGWTAFQQKPAGRGGPGARPDLPVPVLAAVPRTQDVPVYLEAVGSVRALNNVIVRAQVDGKLMKVNFVEGQDVKQGDVLAEIDPVIYQAQYDQAGAKKAQDEALLAHQEALVQADQAAIDNARAMLGYTKVIAPLSGRAGLRQVDQGNINRAADATGLVIITQLQPIAVQFSLPQQQIVRVNAAAGKGVLAVDVFGNDGVTVVDTGTLKGIDNQVDPTTGTLKLKAEFPNANFQLWPGQFVNVRLKVDTLSKAIVVPTSAVQRGPAGTFSYVIGPDNVATAKPIVVTQQNENDAVIASGLTTSDRVVTTGFANLSDGAKVFIGKDDAAPAADLAPRKRSRAPDAKGGPAKDGEPRGKRGEGDQKGQTGPAAGAPGGTKQ